jgi:hypothetical protein
LVTRLIFLQGIFSGGYNPTLPLAKLNQKPNHIKDIEIINKCFPEIIFSVNSIF